MKPHLHSVARACLPFLVLLLSGCASYVVPETVRPPSAATPDAIAQNFARTSTLVLPTIVVAKGDCHEFLAIVAPNGTIDSGVFNRSSGQLKSNSYEVNRSVTAAASTLTLTLSVTSEGDSHSLEVGPLGVLTLGLVPNQYYVQDTSAAFLLEDSATGYVYAVGEASDRAIQIHNIWTKSGARKDAEKRSRETAIKRLAEQFPKVWHEVVARYQAKPR